MGREGGGGKRSRASGTHLWIGPHGSEQHSRWQGQWGGLWTTGWPVTGVLSATAERGRAEGQVTSGPRLAVLAGAGALSAGPATGRGGPLPHVAASCGGGRGCWHSRQAAKQSSDCTREGASCAWPGGGVGCVHGHLRATTGASRTFDVAISARTCVGRKDAGAHFNSSVYAPAADNRPTSNSQVGRLGTAGCAGRPPLGPPGHAFPHEKLRP